MGLLDTPQEMKNQGTQENFSLKQLKTHFDKIKRRSFRNYQRNKYFQKKNSKSAKKAEQKAEKALKTYNTATVSLELIDKTEKGLDLSPEERVFLGMECVEEAIDAQQAINAQENEHVEEMEDETTNNPHEEPDNHNPSLNRNWYPAIGLLPPPPTSPVFTQNAFPHEIPNRIDGGGKVWGGKWRNGAQSTDDKSPIEETSFQRRPNLSNADEIARKNVLLKLKKENPHRKIPMPPRRNTSNTQPQENRKSTDSEGDELVNWKILSDEIYTAQYQDQSMDTQYIPQKDLLGPESDETVTAPAWAENEKNTPELLYTTLENRENNTLQMDVDFVKENKPKNKNPTENESEPWYPIYRVNEINFAPEIRSTVPVITSGINPPGYILLLIGHIILIGILIALISGVLLHFFF